MLEERERKRRVPESYIVWLNEANRIASFHQVEGYQSRTFTSHDFFISFLHSLQEQGYRFQ